ncbi:MAG: hypothetical protein C4K58_07705 [Flavobacteriaceae bacterium]|nr:MAG: hypothetical protein C4K58_07705 [Flavobacteriaceae bacterium]
MKSAGISQIKEALKQQSYSSLVELCLKLSSYKIENKQYLSYLLFDTHQREEYLEDLKGEIDLAFDNINQDSYFYVNKSLRKILREAKKHIKFAKDSAFEMELMIHFLKKTKSLSCNISQSPKLLGLYKRENQKTQKLLEKIEPDLWIDYQEDLKEIEDF